MAEIKDTPYKYSCRKCPIRARCIERSDNSPITKDALRNAFENQTDTLEMWGLLQTRCLLIEAEQKAQETRRESLLSRRIRQAKEAKRASSELPSEPPPPPAAPSTPRSKPKPRLTPDYLTSPPPAEQPLEVIRDPDQLTKQEIIETRTSGQRYWLTVRRSGRHISLPIDGELVLGRFDPQFGIPPDVDLTFEDGPTPSVSRRHAKIVGVGGIHSIQEMGSKLGVQVNGKKISLGVTHRLQKGDMITLGRCSMVYDPFPRWLEQLTPAHSILHVLMIACTGQKIRIPPGRELVIGRSDRFVDFTPDIDLSELQTFASKVSRRHARLWSRPNETTLFIEDMGSGFGTKINGELLLLGNVRPLQPGDHIWLGGCVLAYDVLLQ